MEDLNEISLTESVLQQMADTPDPRLRAIMTAAVKHLHAFAREVSLTPEEWLFGIKFMTQVGQACTPFRQEFMRLEVWQTDPDGAYDLQAHDPGVMDYRANFRTDGEGRYHFRATYPLGYTIPMDGPVGGMIRGQGRHGCCPAHTHFLIGAPGEATSRLGADPSKLMAAE